jgi:predicted RNA-binding Zn-ribbon protein involved in translation (DUF1610 family)
MTMQTLDRPMHQTPPRRRYDLELIAATEPTLAIYEWYSWPFVCPRCGYAGEYRCGIDRRATEALKEAAFAHHRRDLAREPGRFCPRCGTPPAPHA